MNSPQLTAKQSLIQPDTNKCQTSGKQNAFRLPYRTNSNNQLFKLLSCHRPIMQTDKRGGFLPLEHCYAKLVTQDGQTIDSISYDGPSGVSQAKTPDNFTSNCQIVKLITKPQWQTFKQKIYQNCQTENFSLANNNCCSCLGRIFAENVGYIPANIEQAHEQIESNRQYVIL